MPTISKDVYSNMSATVQIIIDEKDNVLVIPSRTTKSIK